MKFGKCAAAMFAFTFVLALVYGYCLNLLNVEVSSRYFIYAMNWESDNIRDLALAQGMFEASIIGTILGGIVAITYVLRRRTKANIAEGITLSLRLFGLVVLATLIGGAMGIVAGTLAPEWILSNLGVNDPKPYEALRLGWVGGSIQGAEIGGAVFAALGLVSFWLQGNEVTKLTLAEAPSEFA